MATIIRLLIYKGDEHRVAQLVAQSKPDGDHPIHGNALAGGETRQMKESGATLRVVTLWHTPFWRIVAIVRALFTKHDTRVVEMTEKLRNQYYTAKQGYIGGAQAGQANQQYASGNVGTTAAQVQVNKALNAEHEALQKAAHLEAMKNAIRNAPAEEVEMFENALTEVRRG